MGFLSATATLCYDGGRNPDVEELLTYNLQAKRASCSHDTQRSHETDDHHYYRICSLCGQSSDSIEGLPQPKYLNGRPL